MFGAILIEKSIFISKNFSPYITHLILFVLTGVWEFVCVCVCVCVLLPVFFWVTNIQGVYENW